MEIKITMKVTDLTRELAGMYAAGRMTHEEYLDAWEDLMRAIAEEA